MTQEEASYGTGLCDKCYNVLCTQYVKTTAGEVHLYRWGPLYDHVNEANHAHPSLWDVPVSTNDDRIRQFVSRVKEEFWQPWKTHAGCAQGLGLYCATDAASTRAFGGSGEWCLIQLRMPAGTPYLDMTIMPGTWLGCVCIPSFSLHCLFVTISTCTAAFPIQLFRTRKSSCFRRQAFRRCSTPTAQANSVKCRAEESARLFLWTTGQ
jgi:hypothetical protein